MRQAFERPAGVRTPAALVGCYAIPDVPEDKLGAALDAAAKAVVATRRVRQPEVRVSVPAMAEPRPVAPGLVRLDTARDVRGLIVRSASTAEPIGTWFIAENDSVRVVLLVAGTYTLSASSRVVCSR